MSITDAIESAPTAADGVDMEVPEMPSRRHVLDLDDFSSVRDPQGSRDLFRIKIR